MPMISADFRQGMRDSVPVLIGVAPFGLLFGALAVENGLDIVEATLMSALIFGGASQMVGIDLFGTRIAPWMIVLSIFAVNFRHVLYSASLGPKLVRYSGLQKAVAFFFLTDVHYSAAERRHELGLPFRFGWYMGLTIPLYVIWIVETAIGGLFGRLITNPQSFGIDMLLPVYFLGIVVGFRRRRNWLPVVIASGLASLFAYVTIGSPWHVSIGAVAGVSFAALIAGDQPVVEPEVNEAEEIT